MVHTPSNSEWDDPSLGDRCPLGEEGEGGEGNQSHCL